MAAGVGLIHPAHSTMQDIIIDFEALSWSSLPWSRPSLPLRLGTYPRRFALESEETARFPRYPEILLMASPLESYLTHISWPLAIVWRFYNHAWKGALQASKSLILSLRPCILVQIKP